MSRARRRSIALTIVGLPAALLALLYFAGDDASSPRPSSDAHPASDVSGNPVVASEEPQVGRNPAGRRQVLVEATVTVVDSEGRPVSDADVAAVGATESPGGGVREGRTRADGTALLSLPITAHPWTILVNWRVRTHERLARGAARLATECLEDAHCRVELLCLGARLEVVVTDDTRSPVSGVVVTTNYEDVQQMTDRSGTARFDALPSGWRPIDVQLGPDARADIALPTECRQFAQLQRGGTTFLTFVMPRRASLEVRLAPTVLDRAAVVEVVSAKGDLRREVTLDAAGSAKLDGLPPGDYTVAARFGDDSPWDGSAREPVTLRSGEQRIHVLQARHLGGALRGSVVDEAMRPVVGALVCVRSAARASAPALEKRAITDEAGRFSVVGLEVGMVECSVLVQAITDRDFQYLGGVVPWLTMPCPDEGVVLRLQRSPGVRGRVVDQRGRPIRARSVHLQREGFPVDRRVTTADGDGGAGDELKAGAFMFRHVMPGTYRLWVEEGDRSVERTIVVEQSPDAPPVTHDLVLPMER